MSPRVRTGLHPVIPAGLAAILFLLALVPTRTTEEYELVFEYAVDGRVYQGTALDPGGFVSWTAQRS